MADPVAVTASPPDPLGSPEVVREKSESSFAPEPKPDEILAELAPESPSDDATVTEQAVLAAAAEVAPALPSAETPTAPIPQAPPPADVEAPRVIKHATTARRVIQRPAPVVQTASITAENCGSEGLQTAITHSPGLQVEGRGLGPLELKIAPGGQVLACLGDLVTLFRDRLGPAEYSRLHASSAAREYVSLQDLVLSGFTVAYDPESDRLDLGLPQQR